MNSPDQNTDYLSPKPIPSDLISSYLCDFGRRLKAHKFMTQTALASLSTDEKETLIMLISNTMKQPKQLLTLPRFNSDDELNDHLIVLVNSAADLLQSDRATTFFSNLKEISGDDIETFKYLLSTLEKHGRNPA